MDFKNIKFRAWYEGKMFEVIKFDFRTGDVYLEDFVNFQSLWVKADEVELMMYTGLQDKYGKDIYEGDIVSTKVMEDYLITTTKEIREIGVYVATSIDNESYGGPDMSIIYRDVKIIGNKYENPELVQYFRTRGQKQKE